jgi:hypothetical protein
MTRAVTSTFQATKLEVVSTLGLSKDALHIYVGLLVFLAAAALLRRPLGSSIPLAMVLVVACVGEIFDARDDIADLGCWRAGASMHDIVNTMFWPAVLFALARYTKVLR